MLTKANIQKINSGVFRVHKKGSQGQDKMLKNVETQKRLCSGESTIIVKK